MYSSPFKLVKIVFSEVQVHPLPIRLDAGCLLTPELTGLRKAISKRSLTVAPRFGGRENVSASEQSRVGSSAP
jgi:hypothetical protein